MILVLIIGVIIAFLVWFFLLRKKPDDPQLSIFFQPSNIILNPANRTVETYVLEYLADPSPPPSPSGNLGRNIDLEITWTNGFGFTNAGVTGFVLRRRMKSSDKYINVSSSSVDDPTSLTVTVDNDLGNTINVTDDKTCTVKILGDYIGSSVIEGVNVIEVSAIVGDNEIPVGALEVTITSEHLEQTLKISQVVKIEFNPVNARSFEYDIITDSANINFAPQKLNTPLIKTELVKENGSNKIVIQEDVGDLRKGNKYVILSYLSEPIRYIFSQTSEVSGEDKYIVYDGNKITTKTLTKAELNPTVLFDDKTSTTVEQEDAVPSTT